MTTCINSQVWAQAQAACAARQASVSSVRGFGYSATGLRGLGATLSQIVANAAAAAKASASPAESAASAAAAQRALQAAQAAYAAPSVIANPINTTPDPNDPCVIASQTPCPGPSSGSASAPPASASTPTQASVAGGFQHWGLLAALAVGGGALYLVTRKKS